jgi:peptide/nickel transport system substrate-binding protein
MTYCLRKGKLLCGFCVAVVAIVCIGEQSRSPSERDTTPDTLILATTVEPATLHPVFGGDRMSAVEILGALFEPLTVYDDQHRLRPCLATEIPTRENGGIRILSAEEEAARGGQMESVWHLRPGASWSDGTPVTAHDFSFTLDLIKHPDIPALIREVEDRIVRMESRDGGRTLVVLWKKPYAFAAEGHRHLVIPRHLEGPRFEALDNKKEYERTPFNREPVGNGPYRIAEWKMGRHLVLERQPHWNGPAPHFRRLIYRFIPEAETVLANLDTARVGAVSPVALDYDLAKEYEQRAQLRHDCKYVVAATSSLSWVHIDFNLDNPLTADRRVRQALTAGLNRQGMCQLLFPGQDCATDTWLAPIHPCCFPPPGQVAPDLPRYPYDPQRAARLLDEAGWPLASNGLRSKEYLALQLTLSYLAGDALMDRVAQIVKEDWRVLGVDLHLQPMEAKHFGELSSKNLEYKGLSLYSWIMDPSADGITFWTAENIPTVDKLSGQNACRWRNARSDELLYRATQTFDLPRRRELLWEQQRLWADDLPAIPLFFQQEVSIRRHDLEGWRPTGTDTPVTWNCFEWRWR